MIVKRRASYLTRFLYWLRYRNISYKVLKECPDGLKTPVANAYVTDNHLKATGELFIEEAGNGFLIGQGMIHCFRSKIDAFSYASFADEKVFKVKGKKIIALNNRQVGFESIELLEEIKDGEFA